MNESEGDEPHVLSTMLFESSGVSVFKIPPGKISLTNWNLDLANIIWKGDLRLIEQEVLSNEMDLFSLYNTKGGDDDTSPTMPFKGLRLKLELFQVLNLADNRTADEVWAEVWYNPMISSSSASLSAALYLTPMPTIPCGNLPYSIANNGQETIQITPESSKYYKIIAQLPGSGYHPFEGNLTKENQEGALLQIALGLRFDHTDEAMSFSESLNIYRRRFKNFEEQYDYELKLLQLERKLQNLSIKYDDDTDDGGSTGSQDGNSNLMYPIGSIVPRYDDIKDGRGDERDSNVDNSIEYSSDYEENDNDDNDDDDDGFGDFVTNDSV
ncbi:uncharacterized protein PRCAT00002208001 [Priceomyces carsonii]|uniref:uncharacterized protein n=1 Tax=Priceomyces carsonii TaxID=28549 RepID=UPI002ED8D2CD|nr:unnamed protein product [Priceomyces carsonii]